MQNEKRKVSPSRLSAETFEECNQHDISCWKTELDHCSSLLIALKKRSTGEMSRLQLAHHKNKVCLENRRKLLLIEKLKSAGVRVEKRGRPKKDPTKTYKQTHAKFTAMLKPENLDYLRQLKKQEGIANISVFLDELIEKHRQSVVDSKMESPND